MDRAGCFGLRGKGVELVVLFDKVIDLALQCSLAFPLTVC